MSSPRQYYEVLGLRFNASPDEIKRAYRTLAKQWHPDRFPHDPHRREEAEARFKEITAAYGILKDAPGNDPVATAESRASERRTEAGTFYRQGAVYAERGRYKEAIEEFSHAIASDPDYSEAYEYRAFIFSQLGFDNRARTDFRKAEDLKKQPGYTPPPEEPTPESTVFWMRFEATIQYFQPITNVAIDRRGQVLAYGSHDHTIQVWNLKTEETMTTLREDHPVRCLTLDAGADLVISGHADRALRLWHLKTQKTEILGHKNTEHKRRVLAIALSPDGKTLISGGSDKTVKIWTLNSSADPHTLTGYAADITSIAISPDGKYFVAAGLEPHLRIRDVATGKLIRSIKSDAGFLSIAFSPDGQLLATAGIDRSLRLWYVNTGQEIWNFTGHLDRVSSVLFTPDGRTLISASWDSTIKFWSLATKEEIGSLNGHTDRVLSLALSADGKTLLSGSSDRTLKIWKKTS